MGGNGINWKLKTKLYYEELKFRTVQNKFICVKEYEGDEMESRGEGVKG